MTVSVWIVVGPRGLEFDDADKHCRAEVFFDKDTAWLSQEEWERNCGEGYEVKEATITW